MAADLHRGDGGATRLATGQLVRKDDLRIECVGGVDELSCFLGLARAALAAGQPIPAEPRDEFTRLLAWLGRIQHELHLLGADLAQRNSGEATARIGNTHVEILDGEITRLQGGLPKLDAFILAGGGVVAAHLHVARAVCRRVERQAVRLFAAEALGSYVLPYLNRLSLALFYMARQAAFLFGESEEMA
jgi:cob(I)alamin adenosyltransferase